MNDPPLIHVITTGGTVASAQRADGPGYSPALTGRVLIDTFLAESPGWQRTVRLEVEEFSRVPSFMFEDQDLERLLRAVRFEVNRDELDAIVIVQGTAAMEETAFLLDIAIRVDTPIVVTGAMINASLPGRDGPRNFWDAVRVAVDPRARGIGVAIAMSGMLHAALDAIKVHRTSPNAFYSEAGPLALLDVDRPVFLRQPRSRSHLPVERLTGPVDIVAASLAADGRLIRAALETGARGIVVQGFPGSGGVTPAMMRELIRAFDKRVPVVVSSRSPFGRALPTAGGGAGARDLYERGAILSGSLGAAKSRLLLMCALTNGMSVDSVRDVFAATAP